MNRFIEILLQELFEGVKIYEQNTTRKAYTVILNHEPFIYGSYGTYTVLYDVITSLDENEVIRFLDRVIFSQIRDPEHYGVNHHVWKSSSLEGKAGFLIPHVRELIMMLEGNVIVRTTPLLLREQPLT